MARQVSLLILGAGPYGLAMARYAKQHDIEALVVGKPMDFWKSNMPKGMFLRSGCDWHLDPLGVYTIEHYLQTKQLTAHEVEPLLLDFYLGYAQWFQTQSAVEVLPALVQRLDYVNDRRRAFEATLADGQTISAQNVVLALGFRYFKHVPAELAQRLPADRYAHTCDYVNFEALKGKRALIIGGRQSAFEWAALMREAGATEVYISHRHASPTFIPSDWSWVLPLVNGMMDNPAWFRQLPAAEQELWRRRLFIEGRLKVEPWLASRLRKDGVYVWAHTHLVSCEAHGDEVIVRFESGTTVAVDQLVLATGYQTDMSRVPLLAQGNVLPMLQTRNGYPILDEHFQTNLTGLFITSLPSTQDFGPFFGFTVGVRAAAHIIGHALHQRP
jgi:thioredoxin reductase